jgi:hypothetical protein
MSWHYSREFINFTIKQKINEELNSVQGGIRSGKKGASVLLEGLCQCFQGEHEERNENGEKEKLELHEDDEQGRVFGDVRWASSLCGRQEDDSGAHNDNGVAHPKKDCERRVRSSQKWSEDGQSTEESGTTESLETQQGSQCRNCKDTKKGKGKVCVSSPCLRALVEGYSEATCLDGGVSALSNGNPTPQAYLSPDRMKAFSRLSRFGMTSEPLTEDHGAALLTWYLAAFHARTSAQPERELASQENVPACGKKWHGSLARYDRATCSWRTAQYSLLGDLELFSETWPRWGTMRNGECSMRLMPEHFTSGSVFGYWPTPTKMMTPSSSAGGAPGVHLMGAILLEENGYSHEFRGDRGSALILKHPEWRNGRKTNPTWTEWLMGFPLRWTAITPLAMPKFQQWCASHGIPFTNELENDKAA